MELEELEKNILTYKNIYKYILTKKIIQKEDEFIYELEIEFTNNENLFCYGDSLSEIISKIKQSILS